MFSYTCRAALSDSTNSRRPTLLTSQPLSICWQIPFHFHTNHLERGSRPHSAGRMLYRPCGFVPHCAITPLNCYLLCLFVSLYSYCSWTLCFTGLMDSVCFVCIHMHPFEMYVIPYAQWLSWKPRSGLVSSCCPRLEHAGTCGDEGGLIISHHLRSTAT